MTALIGSASAPGKVILFGEHAVVYGQPAVAAPVFGVQSTASVEATDEPLNLLAPDLDLALDLAPWRLSGDDASDSDASGDVSDSDASDSDASDDQDQDPDPVLGPLTATLRAGLAVAGRNPEDCRWRIEVTSTVPRGRGMGSSASVSVALARALNQALETSWSDTQLLGVAMAGERAAHGKPSGIDPTVIQIGRPILFFPPEPARTLSWPPDAVLLVADSGSRGSTRSMIDGVARRRATSRTAYDRWFNQMGDTARQAASAMAAGDVPRLGRLMNSNHLLLQAIGVSTKRLDDLVATARESGAYGAKLSGAGGGGVVVALTDTAGRDRVEARLLEARAAAVYAAELS